MAEKKITGWFTMNGKHIPIFEGESKEDAVNRSIAKDNEDKKQADIKAREEQIKKANEPKKPTKEQVKEFSKSPNKAVRDQDKKLGKTMDAKDPETGLLKSSRDRVDKMNAEELDKEIAANAAYMERVKAKIGKGGDDEFREKTLQKHQKWQEYLQNRRNSLDKTSSLSDADKAKITKDIQSHTAAENDAAEKQLQTWFDKEKNVIDNYDTYVAVGKVKSKNDEWWKSHEDNYNGLKDKLEFFRAERKRLSNEGNTNSLDKKEQSVPKNEYYPDKLLDKETQIRKETKARIDQMSAKEKQDYARDLEGFIKLAKKEVADGGSVYNKQELQNYQNIKRYLQSKMSNGASKVTPRYDEDKYEVQTISGGRDGERLLRYVPRDPYDESTPSFFMDERGTKYSNRAEYQKATKNFGGRSTSGASKDSEKKDISYLGSGAILSNQAKSSGNAQKTKREITMELRKKAKDIIIAKKGKVLNADFNALREEGYNGTDIQNAFNYFEFSPTQAKFREKYGYGSSKK